MLMLQIIQFDMPYETSQNIHRLDEAQGSANTLP